MPSPFPGMDPCLEAPDIWQDFHDALAGEIRAELNRSLPAPYYARLEMQFIEIRDPTRGHHLVTLIEIVSPSNKLPGPDRRAYLRKQDEILQSDASLVEIDFLRSGERLIMSHELLHFIEQLRPHPHYLALVNRSWRREASDMAFVSK